MSKNEDGFEKLKSQATKLKTETEETVKTETEEATKALELTRQKLATMYKGDAEASVGTEDIDAGDLNIPQLKLVQPNKRLPLADGTKSEEGWFYRTDTKQQFQTIDVVMLVVKKVTMLNYKKTAMEPQHIYFGLYKDSTEPFRFFCRGWSLSGSREFLTEVKRVQGKYKVPMFALKVKLRSIPKTGTTDDGADYAVYQTVFEIQKTEGQDMPIVEEQIETVSVLREFVDRFEGVASKQAVPDDHAEEGSDQPH